MQATPGLEPFLADELASLGLKGRELVGGVEVKGSWDALARVHRWSRLASRVLVRLGDVHAPSLEALAAGVRKLPWTAVLHPKQDVDVDVSTHGATLRHGSTVSKKVGHAIRDALRGPRLPPGRPPAEAASVKVRIVGNTATISIDASGDRLHRRGWREATAKAPIRENLAATVLWAVGWRPGEPLVDPMCGAGTFPIEAARWASGLPPALDDAAPWQAWAGAKGKPGGGPGAVPTAIHGSDRDPGALAASTANARRAGVADRVALMQASWHERPVPGGRGLIVVNPPYGRRIGDHRAVGRLYDGFGAEVQARWAGWRVALVVPDPTLARRVHPRSQVVASFKNGGIPVVITLADDVDDH